MRTLTFVSVLLFGLAQSATAQDRPSKELSQDEAKTDMCSKVQCQKNLHVTLKKRDGTIFDRTFEVMSPTIQGNSVFIFPGQTVLFTTELDGSKLKNPKLATDPNAPNVIALKLEQTPDGVMMLSVKNPYEKFLKFRMGIMPLEKPELFATTSCPAVPKGGAYESWPDPIFQIVVTSGRLLEPKDSLACTKE